MVLVYCPNFAILCCYDQFGNFCIFVVLVGVASCFVIGVGVGVVVVVGTGVLIDVGVIPVFMLGVVVGFVFTANDCAVNFILLWF